LERLSGTDPTKQKQERLDVTEATVADQQFTNLAMVRYKKVLEEQKDQLDRWYHMASTEAYKSSIKRVLDDGISLLLQHILVEVWELDLPKSSVTLVDLPGKYLIIFECL
jgi:hypothetical protein